MVASIDLDGLQALCDALVDAGYALVGPVVRDGVITLAEFSSVDDLPRGVHDEQAPGSYRLVPGGGSELFGFATPALSWKPYLFPARRPMWRLDDSGAPVAARLDTTRRALIGVRSCDLRAVETLDGVLAERA